MLVCYLAVRFSENERRVFPLAPPLLRLTIDVELRGQQLLSQEEMEQVIKDVPGNRCRMTEVSSCG